MNPNKIVESAAVRQRIDKATEDYFSGLHIIVGSNKNLINNLHIDGYSDAEIAVILGEIKYRLRIAKLLTSENVREIEDGLENTLDTLRSMTGDDFGDAEKAQETKIRQLLGVIQEV